VEYWQFPGLLSQYLKPNAFFLAEAPADWLQNPTAGQAIEANTYGRLAT
jgi:hypothetical protein